MSITAGLAEVVDNSGERRDDLLSFLCSRQVGVERGVDDFDHQFGDESGKADQCSVTAINQRLQQELVVAGDDGDVRGSGFQLLIIPSPASWIARAHLDHFHLRQLDHLQHLGQ